MANKHIKMKGTVPDKCEHSDFQAVFDELQIAVEQANMQFACQGAAAGVKREFGGNEEPPLKRMRLESRTGLEEQTAPCVFIGASTITTDILQIVILFCSLCVWQSKRQKCRIALL